MAVEPGYKNVLRFRLAILWTVLSVAAAVAGSVAFHRPLLALPVFTIGILVVLIVPKRRYARLRYGLSSRVLQVVRGWLFHTDTVVPLVRVQHLDVTRGPLDKLFGTANLVLHTAGTHNSIVAVPGLAPERAAEIRDIIREHVRTDFA
jgi:membrane protein YdbS with pleckstrin-like domain